MMSNHQWSLTAFIWGQFHTECSSFFDMKLKTINLILQLHLPGNIELTHWGRDKIDAILQTTLSNAFSWMKMFEYWLKFHWSLFPMVQLRIFQQWFRSWLGAVQATSHYLNQWWLVYQRIYASLCLNELTPAILIRPDLIKTRHVLINSMVTLLCNFTAITFSVIKNLKGRRFLHSSAQW